MAKLIANVYVDYTWWGPAHGNADQVPDDVAAKITNPDVWGDDDPTVEVLVETQATPAAALGDWLSEAPLEEIVRLATMASDDGTWAAGILDAAGDRRDEIAAALAGEPPAEPPGTDPAATLVDITALDDDALLAWLSDHKADEVLAAVDEALAGDVATDDDKATFVARVIASEAAGKDRKGIAEQLDAIVERLTAPPSTQA